MNAFISYSHKDEKYLERLKTHLVQMKREGLITDWTDREIYAGGSLNAIIDKALESSELFLALVSPDYIASNYCYEKEFETALEMQESGNLIIVPIIVEPCDWQKTPFGKLKAVPKDGKPVSEWTNENVAYLNVIDELRRLTKYTSTIASNRTIQTSSEKLTRNYKIKKYFSEIDKFNFIEESYNNIHSYFQSSIEELNSVENIQARFTKEEQGSFTCLISNRANSQNSFITVSSSIKGQRNFGDLMYTFNEQSNPNSIQMDKTFRIENDEYNEFWKKSSFSLSYQNQSDENRFTAHQVAQTIWNDFISQVGVSVE